MLSVLLVALAGTPVASMQSDSVLAACEMAADVIGRTLDLEPHLDADTTVQHPFRSGAAGLRRGCRVTVHGDDRPASPVDDVVEALQAAGWEMLLAYMADGPDGSVAGFAAGPALCIVEGRWDGGDDADTTYVPVPGYDLEVRCFRRTPADDDPA